MRKFVLGRLRSIGYAGAGLVHLVRSQKNAWVHVMATILVLIAGIVERVGVVRWCWLIAAIGAVWMAEALNTAVELLADAAVPQKHPLVGRAKDVAAGAVLVVAIAAAAVGFLIFCF